MERLHAFLHVNCNSQRDYAKLPIVEASLDAEDRNEICQHLGGNNSRHVF